MSHPGVPSISIAKREDGGQHVMLCGEWTLAMMAATFGTLSGALEKHALDASVTWNCLGMQTMDSAGAILLWRSWRRKLPTSLLARPEQLRIFERIGSIDLESSASVTPNSPFDSVMAVGNGLLGIGNHLRDLIRLIGQLLLDFAHLLRNPHETPLREISANLYKAGVRAMPVTALVGFLIGVVMSYLSALQLKQFGAEIFIVNILGMGIIRELGPVLVAVLVAGRSGSAMTAQLGVMRVTEEVDALATMGVSRSLRLIFPKVFALAVAMPLLVLWTSAIALIGGMVSAQLQLDISYGFFFETLPKVVPLSNLWIGLVKGVVFGFMVALVACHFGLRVQPNTESLSANTTSSVVTAITVAILIDAIIAIATRHIGIF